MDFSIFENFQEHCFEVRGKIPRRDLGYLYCDISKEDRYKLHLLEELASKSKRMSDWLMYISELMRVQEEKNSKIQVKN